MCESGNAGESSVLSRAACIFTHRAYFMRVACILTRFERDNPLARIKPDLNTLETINAYGYSKKLHRGNALHMYADESHRFVAHTLSLLGGYRGAA